KTSRKRDPVAPVRENWRSSPITPPKQRQQNRSGTPKDPASTTEWSEPGSGSPSVALPVVLGSQNHSDGSVAGAGVVHEDRHVGLEHVGYEHPLLVVVAPVDGGEATVGDLVGALVVVGADDLDVET